jgi:hypothetical protein
LTERKKVKTIQKIAAYNKEYGEVYEFFITIEEGLKNKKKYKKEKATIGTVFLLCTEDGEFLDDAREYYSSEKDAFYDLEEIAFSHCASKIKDSDGVPYGCVHCGIDYSAFYENGLPKCTVEKRI